MLIVSMEKIDRNHFEEYYRELLKKMYKELDEYWKNYNLDYYKKRRISYDDFVKYCYNYTSNQNRLVQRR